MTISPARRIAFDVLRRVEAQGAFAADVLYARLDTGVKREDGALATELVLGVLRWRRLLDFLIERQGERPAAAFDLEVLLALRLGLYQLRFLTRVPAAAAVNESVELVKAARKGSAAGLVNATLRHAPREPAATLVPDDWPPAERLGVLHSHPTWLVQRWLERFGEQRALELLESNNRAPHPTCAVLDPSRVDQIAAALSTAGFTVEPARWLRAALRLHGGNPLCAEPFALGWCVLQDEASQMLPLLMGVRAGQRVLDLCAAPGGKTIRLAQAAEAGRVVAADLHAARLRAMRGLLKRVGLGDIPLVALDGGAPLPFSARFDRILVDAPCSGTGTLDRNPEIRWRLRPEDVPALEAKQRALLGNALERLAPGGWLVYSTCSLEPEENERVVERVLEGQGGVRRVSGAAALAPHLLPGADAAALFDADGYFRTFPPVHGTNGFFAAIIERDA